MSRPDLMSPVPVPAQPVAAAPPPASRWGVAIALGVFSLWGAHLAFALTAAPASGLSAVHVLLQAWLFTGLFITGHDAMHGTVSPNRRLNDALGALACFLFAGLSWRRLVRNHRAHHASPTGADDPDHDGRGTGFWRWFVVFFARYVTLWQLVVMAAVFNLLELAGVQVWRLWLFWALPSVLASLQLFFFGTYLPHRAARSAEDGLRMVPHHARSLAQGHVFAMLSCYFFGYHWEHHASPGTPWWRLWQQKDARVAARQADLGMGVPAPPR